MSSIEQGNGRKDGYVLFPKSFRGELTRLEVAGGNIKNIALNAAFLAAEAGTAVDMAEVMHARRDFLSVLEQHGQSEIANLTR